MRSAVQVLGACDRWCVDGEVVRTQASGGALFVLALHWGQWMFNCLGDLGTKSNCEARPGTRTRHWQSEKCGQRPAASGEDSGSASPLACFLTSFTWGQGQGLGSKQRELE